MGIENEEAHISLIRSLDSIRDVALAEYADIKDDDGKKDYSAFVTETVKQFLIDNKEKRKDSWTETNLSGKAPLCPPGFKEVDGICVPITLF